MEKLNHFWKLLGKLKNFVEFFFKFLILLGNVRYRVIHLKCPTPQNLTNKNL